MNMVYCTCNISVLNDLINIFDECNIGNYQITKEVIGKSACGEPRMNTSVWPGYNSTLISQVNEEQLKLIISKIKDFNKKAYNDNENISLSSWQLDNYIE